eukprot:TRINITY_DN12265_c0_g1_i1.p1 TRINITY_DN12265_c0_g1~~TRINITY_DN12265_c0_g1_i1.p1  ORF type:complete len:578 (-),score=103.86 TRINITY_DN12265_c0_g1_i1:72-1805(-)
MDIFGETESDGSLSRSKESRIAAERSDLNALSEALGRLLEDQTASDITFYVGPEKTPIKAHKAILVARSEYFRNMFCNSLIESKSGIVEKPNIDAETFRDILYYMYTGRVKVNTTFTARLLAAADEMQLEELKPLVFAATFETSGVNEHTVFRHLEDAMRYNCRNILKFLIEYVESNAFDCLTPSNMAMLSHEGLQLILSQDELDIDEETLFDRVVCYCKTASPASSLKETFLRFAHLIRFPVMDPVFIAREVEPLGIVPTDLLMEAYKFFSVPEQVKSTQRTRSRRRCWQWDAGQSSPLLKFEKGVTIISAIDNKWQNALGSRKFTNGRHYFEVFIHRQKKIENSWKLNIGVVKDGFDARKHNVAFGYKMGAQPCWCLITGRGEIVSHRNPSNGQKGTSYGTTCGEGDTVGVMLDMWQRKMEFFKNGVSMGVAFSDVDDGPLRPALSLIGECVLTLRFQRPRSTNLTTSSIPASVPLNHSGSSSSSSSTVAAENQEVAVPDGPLPAASITTPPRRAAVAHTGNDVGGGGAGAGSAPRNPALPVILRYEKFPPRPVSSVNHHASVYDESYSSDSDNE